MKFDYKEYNNFIILKKYLQCDNDFVEIPSKINEKPVTRIADECFYNHPEIKKIQFPA